MNTLLFSATPFSHHTHARTERSIALVGAPFGHGAGLRGTEMGPAAARIAGLLPALEMLGHRTCDLGDIAPSSVVGDHAEYVSGLGNHASNVSGWITALHESVFSALSDGHRLVVVGGDHSLAMGSVSAASRHAAARNRKLKVLWIDAHADFNTPASSPSGNLHGMGVAFLTGNNDLSRLLKDQAFPAVSPQDMTIIGARSIDAEEKRRIAIEGLGCIDMRAIDEFGICALMRQLLAGIDPATTDLHVSFDLDVLDPALAPGVGTPVEGGLTYREAHLMMEMLHESGMVTSLDVLELNPMLDHAGQTTRAMIGLVASLFGKTITTRTA